MRLVTTTTPEPDELAAKQAELDRAKQFGRQFRMHRYAMPRKENTFQALSKATDISIAYLRQIETGWVPDPSSSLMEGEKNVRPVKPRRNTVIAVAQAVRWDVKEALQAAGYHVDEAEAVNLPTEPFPVEEWLRVPEKHHPLLRLMMRYLADPDVPLRYLVAKEEG